MQWSRVETDSDTMRPISSTFNHTQLGEFKSDYFGERFDTKETDDARLQRVAKILNDDRAQPPLRLVITYMSRIDHDGHKFGPNAPEIDQAVRETDESLGRFVQSTIDWFNAAHSPRPRHAG